MICAHCGAPVRYVKEAGGYLHSRPLAEFRISRWEADDIRRNPPPKHRVLDRQTFIHPAQPARR